MLDRQHQLEVEIARRKLQWADLKVEKRGASQSRRSKTKSIMERVKMAHADVVFSQELAEPAGAEFVNPKIEELSQAVADVTKVV